jgi:NAD(P)-dependent dehydrogenase (short-subunit alcohol dehydrogenase family)
MADPWRGSVAIVTGAGSGIGRALSLELARRGCLVVAADVDAASADATATTITVAGGGARAVALDVADADAFQALCADTVRRHGAVDYLFNNAGIAVGGDVRDVAAADWKRIVDVNLWGVVNGVRAAYPLMAERGSGHIVNTASLAGLVPFPPLTPYCMTKHAVVGLSASLRGEAAALGVRVTVVCPGFIQSRIYASATMAGVARDDAMNALVWFRKLDADVAARRILDGVARNRAYVVFPAYARAFWWLQRWFPNGTQLVCRHAMREFRKLRKREA